MLQGLELGDASVRAISSTRDGGPRVFPSALARSRPALVRRLTACSSCSAAQAMKVVRISPITASAVSGSAAS